MRVVVKIGGCIAVGPRAASKRRDWAALRHACGVEKATTGLLGEGMRCGDNRVTGGRRRGVKVLVGVVHVRKRPGSDEGRLHR